MSPIDSTIHFSTFGSIIFRGLMSQITLEQYVKQHGQVKAGAALGVTQIAISKALRAGREIFVVIAEDGAISAFEHKSFPSKRWANENCK